MTDVITQINSVQTGLLIVAGLGMIILEIALPSFLFFGFAIGAFTTAFVVAVFSPSFPIVLVTFALSSLISFWLLRYVFRRRGDVHDNGEDVNRF